MEITSIIFVSDSQASAVVKTIDFLSDRMIVFNVHRTPEGKIADCKFGLTENLVFTNAERLVFTSEILTTREFTFNGESIEVGDEEDPEVAENMRLLLAALPPSELAELLN